MHILLQVTCEWCLEAGPVGGDQVSFAFTNVLTPPGSDGWVGFWEETLLLKQVLLVLCSIMWFSRLYVMQQGGTHQADQMLMPHSWTCGPPGTECSILNHPIATPKIESGTIDTKSILSFPQKEPVLERGWFAVGLGQGNKWRKTINGHEVSSWNNENILKLNNGCDCTTLWMN